MNNEIVNTIDKIEEWTKKAHDSASKGRLLEASIALELVVRYADQAQRELGEAIDNESA